jgi:hypothetical protein
MKDKDDFDNDYQDDELLTWYNPNRLYIDARRTKAQKNN